MVVLVDKVELKSRALLGFFAYKDVEHISCIGTDTCRVVEPRVVLGLELLTPIVGVGVRPVRAYTELKLAICP